MADEQRGHGYTDVLPADGGRSAEALLRRTYGKVQKLDDRLAKADQSARCKSNIWNSVR